MLGRLVVLVNILGVASCSVPCPPGQALKQETFAERGQLKARGCFSRAADGSELLQGKWKFYYPNGQLNGEGEYVNAQSGGRKGDTGILREGRTGRWAFWYENGQKREETTYVEGKREGLSVTWHPNGQKKLEINYRDDKGEGPATLWHVNGIKASEGVVNGGRQEGPWVFWHDNGQKSAEVSFKDGEKVAWMSWDREGKKEEGAQTRNVSPGAQPAFHCEIGTSGSGALMEGVGESRDLRSKPSVDAPKIRNEKATALLGEVQYESIDRSTKVQIQCESGDWARVQVMEPEWMRHVVGWVKRDALVSPRPPLRERAITEEDIYWEAETKPYKAIIVKGVNRIRDEDSRCREHIDPNVMVARMKGKPGKPTFFVQCGEGAGLVNVYFTAEDVNSNRPFRAPGHIQEVQAVRLCEAYARQSATHPSTVDFSRVLDLVITEHPDGRTMVTSTFTAKNSFNLELKYRIWCTLDENGFVDGKIKEVE